MQASSVTARLRDITGEGRARLQWAILAAPVVLFAVLGWSRRWVIDDGFINLRIVHQVVAGHGPVLNAGDRVEAFTSPLWLAILVVGDLVIPMRLEYVAVGLGLAFASLGLVLAMAGAARLCRLETRSLLVPAGVLVPLAVAPFWYFQTSGLEIGLVLAWIGACLWLLAGWSRTEERLPWWGLVVIGLGWLVRPELAPMSAMFAAAVLAGQWRGARWRDRLGWLALIVALPAIYQLSRMGYYATLVPNTALAKEASRTRWDRGFDYLRDFAGAYALWLPLLVLALGAYTPLVLKLRRGHHRRALLTVAAFVGGGLAVGTYIVAVGGDYIHARLFLPATFALSAPVAVVPARRAYAACLLLIPWALVASLSFREPGSAYASSSGRVTVEAYGWGEDGAARGFFDGPGIYFSAHRLEVEPADGVTIPTLAGWGIGVSSYGLGIDVDILDLLGLGDTLTSRLELEERGFPGHEKPLPSPWAVALLTAPGTEVALSDVPPPVLLAPMIPTTDGPELAEQVAWARAALECPPIRKLRQSTTAPLTLGRFLSNIVASYDNTRLRIPPDPEDAYHKLCGPGTPPEVRALRAAASGEDPRPS